MLPPIEWNQCRLGDVTVPASTWNPRRDPRPSIRYIDVSAISRDELRIVSEATYSADDAPSRARKIVEAGDTIFATVRPTLRRIARIPTALDGEIVSTAFCVLRPDLRAIDANFLYFAIQLESVMEGIAAMESGASYPAVRDVDVLDQVVPLPPLPEQRGIAAILNTIRTALLHQAQCEVNATALKRAAMRTLFTRGLRGKAQKETEIGPVPASWEQATLGDLCQEFGGALQTGPFGSQLHKDDYRETGVAVVNPTHMDAGRIVHDNVPRISEEDAHRLQRHRLEDSDILFARRGEIGRQALVTKLEEGWLCGTGCFLARVKSISIDNRFLSYQFSTEASVNWLRTHAAGAIMPNLNNVALGRLPVFYPEVFEQCEIVTILEAIDRKIDLHRRKRAVLEGLFKALLHKLMTGEIRVGELDLSNFRGVLPESPLAISKVYA